MGTVIEKMDDESSNSLIKPEDLQIELYFKIHDKINAKNEEISKSYTNNIKVVFNDIKELHHKTIQSIYSLNAGKGNLGVRIAVVHHKGEAEKFNSFELFEKHNISSPNPTSDILMVYTFALYNSRTKDFENYKIINRIRSRISEIEQIENEAPTYLPPGIISRMVSTTARITIQYDDYVKARHFTAMFDEWIKGCHESKNNKLILNLQKVSHLISRFGLLIIYALLAYFTATGVDAQNITLDLIIKFLVIYASVFFIIGNISELILSKIEMAIDSYLPISYLNINKGDAKLISKYSKKNTKSALIGAFNLLGIIGIGLFTNSVYDLIKYFIQ